MHQPTGPECPPVEAGILVGETLGGYRLVGVLGEGPTGVVYVGEDAAGGRRAVKILHDALARSVDVPRLRSEIDRLRDLAPPSLRLPCELLVDGTRVLLVSEQVAGASLSMLVERGLERRAADAIATLLVESVIALHDLGVAHGALKPENLFVTDDGIVAVDASLAAVRAAAGSGVVLGDPTYLAPEQIAGSTEIASDVHAVAVLIERIYGAQLDAEFAALLARAQHRVPEARSDGRRLRDGLARFQSRHPELPVALLVPMTREMPLVAASAASNHHPGHPETMSKQDPHTLHAATKRPGDDAQNDGSVEASLEDFISQANKSFQEPVDGWTLNTDEVELVEEADLAPVKPAKIAAAIKGAPQPLRKTAVGLPSGEAARAEPQPEPRADKGKKNKRNGTSTVQGLAVAPRAAAAPSPVQAEVTNLVGDEPVEDAIEDDTPPLDVTQQPTLAMPSAAQLAQAAQVAQQAQPNQATLVVGAAAAAVTPAPQPVAAPVGNPTGSMPVMHPTGTMPAMPIAQPATSNPLVLFGVMFGAFVLGAIVVVVFLRFMTPQQAPVIVAQPAVPTMPVAAMPAPATVPAVAPATAPAPVAAVPTAAPTAPVAAPAAAVPAPTTTVASAPTVTPITQPVVTPLAPPPPPVEQPKAAAEEHKHSSSSHHASASAAPKKEKGDKAVSAALAPSESDFDAPSPKASKATKPAKHETAEAPASDEAKPAKAAKPAATAKPAKKDEGWVDPFAQ